MQDVTGTVEVALIAASVMVRDRQWGPGFGVGREGGQWCLYEGSRERPDACPTDGEIGRASDNRTVALLTDTQPLGYAVGNSLEVARPSRPSRARS